jgi:L-iduronidase
MRQNMLLIGSIPHEGSLYQRPHDLLEFVTVSGMKKDEPIEKDNPQYNWSKLDKFLNIIVQSGQKLFFELMGNPVGYDFGNFSRPVDQNRWTVFVKELVLHLEEHFGKNEVRSWYFQTWNESAKKWKGNFDGFMKYYNASWDGLNEADPQLQFGGPAVGGLNSPWIIDFIEESGERNPDFISYHHKKGPKRDLAPWVAAERDFLIKLKPYLSQLPSKGIPFIVFNEEADAEGAWWRNRNKLGLPEYTHRATPWYAAFIAKQVHEYRSEIIQNEQLKIIGERIKFRLHNDNAFLRVPEDKVHFLPYKDDAERNAYTPSVGAWKQRTHFAHFGDDDQNYALIKKPAHNVMTMLSLLGNKQYDKVKLNSDLKKKGYGAIFTKRVDEHGVANQVAILVYRYTDDYNVHSSSPATINLSLKYLPFPGGKIAHYRIDQNHSNTYDKWLELGSPKVPTDDNVQELRKIQELGLCKPDLYRDSEKGIECQPTSVFDNNKASLKFPLPSPGVSLILISKKPERTRPAQVTGLYAETFRSLNGEKDEVLIRWDSNSRFIRTYKVFHSNSMSGPFRRINTVNLISTAYIHQLKDPLPDVGAYYRVSAVNYWGKTGNASDVIHVTKKTMPVEIEAESYASKEGAWRQGSNINASGGIYMVVPKGTGNDRQCTGIASGKEHYMEYNFMAPGNGKHYIWVRGFGNGGGHDSVCVSVDDGSLRRLDTAVNTWGWTLLSGFDFTRNSTHNLKIHLREDNTFVDKILITSDPEFTPTN